MDSRRIAGHRVQQWKNRERAVLDPSFVSSAELVFHTTESVENTLRPKDIKSFLVLELMLFLSRELTEQNLHGRTCGYEVLGSI